MQLFLFCEGAEMQRTVVAFGDSITRGYALRPGEGWVELLSASLKSNPGESILVFNAGGNGNTSAEGLKRIEQDVLAHMPGKVLVEFGGNDAVHDDRAVCVDAFENNLRTIYHKVKAKGGEVIFVTFPPVVNEWHQTRGDKYYGKWGGLDGCVEEYRIVTRKLAKKLNCRLFDLDKLLREKLSAGKKEDYIKKDGVHLTPRANKLIADRVLKLFDVWLKSTGY